MSSPHTQNLSPPYLTSAPYPLSGQEEIEATCYSLAERFEHMRSGGQTVPELLLLPIYSTLPADLQVCVLRRERDVWWEGA